MFLAKKLGYDRVTNLVILSLANDCQKGPAFKKTTRKVKKKKLIKNIFKKM